MDILTTKSILHFSTMLLLSTHWVTCNDLVCPSYTQISPCTCTVGTSTLTRHGKLSVGCTSSLTQSTSIDRLFPTIREVNNLSSKAPLDINFFCILDTKLTILDLNSLANVQFDTVSISNNSNLKSISPPRNSVSFSVDYLFFLSHQFIGDENVGHLLKFLRPDTLTGLWLIGNQIQGTLENCGGEFLSGLSGFSSLRWLYLQKNQIKKIGGGQFRRNFNLTILDLSNNGLTKVGADAFLFDNDDPHRPGTLTLILDDNKLTDESINPRYGLQSNSHTAKFISLQRNEFEFISAVNFKSAIYPVGSIYSLKMQGNKFVCDDRMEWIHRDKKQFQSQIQGIDCTNDPTKNIFTTNLVHLPQDKENYLVVDD